MRRLLPLALVTGLVLTACADDGEDAGDPGGSTTTATEAPRSTSGLAPVDSTFVTEDVEALCADLEGLSDIDPEADPTQEQVDRVLAIAATAPEGVAEPLRDVAAFGQAVVDLAPDVVERREAAVDAATLLIAYGNEACEIDVPLFDSIAGV